MSKQFIDKGIALIKVACAADESGDYPNAFQNYLHGIEYLQTGLKYEKNAELQKTIKQRITTYIARAETLKPLVLKPQLQASGSSNGNSGAAGASNTEGGDKPIEEARLLPRKQIARNVEQLIRETIVGQSFAVTSVCKAIRRLQSGWTDEDRPIVWLFSGPSGVGKTEMAKVVANMLYGDDPSGFVRIDMSEYQEKNAVNKFVGAPPGYLGYAEDTLLVLSLKKVQNPIILLDEVEKAHPDVLTILLQLFDEGRLTTGKGETLNCKEAIFVMTSNVASDVIKEHYQIRSLQRSLTKQQQVKLDEELASALHAPLKEAFKRDEFIGRIGEIVPFLPLKPVEVGTIISKILIKWRARALAKHNITLQWDAGLVSWLVKFYNEAYGVRSLKNAVEKLVVSELAEAQLSGKINPNQQVKVSVLNGKIVVQPSGVGQRPIVVN